MAQLYFDPVKLRQYIDRLAEERAHTRRFMELVGQCIEIDTMHGEELRRIYKRLEAIELDLTRLMEASENALTDFVRLNIQAGDSLETARRQISRLFE